MKRNEILFYVQIGEKEVEVETSHVDHHEKDGYSWFYNDLNDGLEIPLPEDFYEKIRSIYSDPNVNYPDDMMYDILKDYIKRQKADFIVGGRGRNSVIINRMTVNGR